MQEKNIGTFEVKSGKICVSDPCYDRGTWCAAWGLLAKNGIWDATFYTSDEGSWGHRIARIEARHKDTLNDIWKKHKTEIGVDSGQAGIYDSKIYPQGNTGDYGECGTFYGRCCDITLKEPGAGIIDGGGIVSRSGFGDGGYDLEVQYDGKEIVAARVTFIPEAFERN